MTDKEEVEAFLKSFHEKMKIFDILFRNDRLKNSQSLLNLELTPIKRREIIEQLMCTDYIEGPNPDTLHKGPDLWIFGKKIKKKDVYIKITMGFPNCSVICISFHVAEQTLKYVFK
ncbi:toxin [Labilibaculum sp.]|uniref:toxin n=1 Tax=Labilibaculum sp. TaxID=2060723 RepID=UPI0035617384